MKGYRFFFALVFVSLLSAAFLGFSSSAQRRIEQVRQVDYQQRERLASPQIKQRLASLRQEIKARQLTFEVGYTTAMDESLDKLAGTRAPANLPDQARRQNQLASRVLRVDLQARDQYLKINPRLPELLVKCSANLSA